MIKATSRMRCITIYVYYSFYLSVFCSRYQDFHYITGFPQSTCMQGCPHGSGIGEKNKRDKELLKKLHNICYYNTHPSPHNDDQNEGSFPLTWKPGYITSFKVIHQFCIAHFLCAYLK